jgi:hypothetical protein
MNQYTISYNLKDAKGEFSQTVIESCLESAIAFIQKLVNEEGFNFQVVTHRAVNKSKFID